MITLCMIDQIYHPLSGCAPLTVSDLLSRCDEEAKIVLELTCLLADYRLKLDDNAHLHDRTDQTLPAGPIPIYYDLTSGLCSADLLRALLALHSEDLYMAT